MGPFSQTESHSLTHHARPSEQPQMAFKICLHLHFNGIHYKSLIIKKWRWFSRPRLSEPLVPPSGRDAECEMGVHLFNTVTALTSEYVTVWIVIFRTITSLPYLCHCHWRTEEACSCRCCWSSGCDGWGWTSLGFWRPRCLQQVLWKGLVTWMGPEQNARFGR